MPSRPSGTESAKREKYTPRACNQCQRRKVKCSGEEICTNCQSRHVDCQYSKIDQDPAARNSAKRTRTSQDLGCAPVHISKRQTEELGRTPPRFASPESSPPDELQSENKFLREQVHQLQRDIDTLFRRRNIDRRSLADTEAVNDPVRTKACEPFCSLQQEEVCSVTAEAQDCTLPNHEMPISEPDDSFPGHGAADTFESSSPWPSPLAICSQISALRLSASHEPSPLDEILFHEKSTFSVNLPEPPQVQELLRVFFHEFECYFPCLHRMSMSKRLSELFTSFKYSKTNVKMSVGMQHYKTTAILFSALAFASSFVASPDTAEWRPGWNYYIQGKELMHHFELCDEADLDLVTYHVISAAFLLHAETLRSACYHVVQGFQASLSIGLNNKSQWHDLPFELSSRRNLWWVLYFLDKRITQKSGVAYFIRESEVAVDDFREDTTTDTGAASRAWLQGLITHSKSWTYIWDNFFAPSALKSGNWDEIQMADARIVIMHQSDYSQLHWVPETIDRCKEGGETEWQIRRRLIVYLRHKFLRLSIRHERLSNVTAELHRRQSCICIAKDILSAIAKYMSFYSSYRPSGYVLTSSLVECIYHIVPEYRDRSSPLDHNVIECTLRKASSLLKTLAESVGAASRAFRALHCVLRTDEMPATSLYKYQHLPFFESESEQPTTKNPQSLSNDPWNTSDTTDLQGWLDGSLVQSMFPTAIPSLPSVAATMIPKLPPDVRSDNTPWIASSQGPLPELFSSEMTYSGLEDLNFDLDMNGY